MNPQNVGAVILGAVALASSAVAASPIASTTATTTYHRTQVEGVGVFYRKGGPKARPHRAAARVPVVFARRIR